MSASPKFLSARPSVAKNSPAMLEVFAELAAQRVAQREVLKSDKNEIDMGHRVPSENRKLRRLVQSLGQVGDALEGRETGANTIELRRSLLRLGADVVAWLEVAP